MDHVNQVEALVRSLQIFRVAHDVFALEQDLNNGRAGGGGAEAVFLHRIGKFFLIESLSGGFHGGEQGGFGEALGGACLLADGFGLEHILGKAAFEAGGQGLLLGVRGICAVVAGFGLFGGGLLLFGLEIEDFPADLLNGFAGGVIAVNQGDVRDCRDDGGNRPDVIVMPAGEEAAADKVIELALVGRQVDAVRRSDGGDDGVVVTDFRVIHIAPAEGFLAGAGGEVFAIGCGYDSDDAGQGFGHVLRNITAVGSGVAEQFVALVEGLGGVQRVLRAEAEEAVGVALQLREVIEERRAHALGFGFDGFDGGGAGFGAGDDLGGFETGGVFHHSFGPGGGQAGGLLNVGDVANPGAFVGFGFRAGSGAEGRDDFEIVFGHEAADGEFAFGHHGEGGGLHAAYAEFVTIGEGIGAGEVHADEPVGTAAPAGGVCERFVVFAGFDGVETFADGFGGEG